MSNIPMGILASAVTPLVLPAVTFDGTNDYLTDQPTFPDGEEGLFSCWVLFNGGDGSEQMFVYNDGGLVKVSKLSNNKIRMIMHNSSSSERIYLDSTTTLTADSTWHHIVGAWKTTSGSEDAQMYIDGVDRTSIVLQNAGPIDYNRTAWGIGARDTGANKLNADVSQLYFTDEYLDLDTPANLAKFYDGGPVDFGADGSTPTGTQPRVYLNNPTASWHTNVGSGGGFTENGALTTAPSSPTD